MNTYYRNVLEKSFDGNIRYVSHTEPLVQTMQNFLKTFYNTEKKVCVSLSGGVDSMVILRILAKLLDVDKIIAFHIQYNNRAVSEKEAHFLKYYCNLLNVRLKTVHFDFKRADYERKCYEDVTNHLRFFEYHTLMQYDNVDGICLGHHSGDIVENVFNNFIQGKNFLDLKKMQVVSTQQNARIWRPFLNTTKKEIYAFAHTYNVPYFQDTTPKTSCRGRMRNVIFPNLENYQTAFVSKMLWMGEQSNVWGDLIKHEILKPFLQRNVEIKNNKVYIHIHEDDLEKHEIVWGSIFTECLHKIHSGGMTKKQLFTLIQNIKSNIKKQSNKSATIHMTINKELKGIFNKTKIKNQHTLMLYNTQNTQNTQTTRNTKKTPNTRNE